MSSRVELPQSKSETLKPETQKASQDPPMAR